jgi:hypothetical protein
MGSRVRGVVVVAVVLAVGAFAGSALSRWWTAPLPSVSGEARGIPAAVAGERVRVEVLNGGGRDRMAARATEVLRDRGFDVVYIDNADVSDQDSTVVLLRRGRAEWAAAAVEVLGTGTWLSDESDNRYVDLTVVLGSDWSPEVAVPDAPEVRERPFWDIRHWFRRPGAPEGTNFVDPA